MPPAILSLLRDVGPLTVAQLAGELDYSPHAVRWHINRNREAVRLAAWRREDRHIVSVWTLADGQPDAPKPRRLTANERAARYRKPRRALLAAKARKAPASPWSAFL